MEKTRTLYLSLKKEWYEMIERGEKREEYREMKPYWDKRLWRKEFDRVVFSYGYTKRRMVFKVDDIVVGLGKKEWGAVMNKFYYVVKLGEKIN